MQQDADIAALQYTLWGFYLITLKGTQTKSVLKAQWLTFGSI